MRQICSPCGIMDRDHPKQGIVDIDGAGFEAIVCDLSLLCGPDDLENMGRKPTKRRKSVVVDEPARMYECLHPVLVKCRELNLDYPIAAAPYLLGSSRRSDLKAQMLSLTEESIKICGRIECGYLVVRPLSVEIAKEDLWKENRKYYLRLGTLARENGVMILLQNQYRDINGHFVRGICSDGEEAVHWVDWLNEAAGEERFGFCVDVGVCNLCGQNMYDFIRKLGSRIKAVVLRDNDGISDNSLLPFALAHQGSFRTDWRSLIRGLREIGYDSFLILNLEDSASAISPILRPALMRYARSAMDYLVWQIEMERLLKKYSSRVLFGAGNMCRNYMKSYGEQYPPLYTCDNNSRLWGTEICGISVRDPKVLKELPQETAIFICNIYYREIEAQLREMGLRNPIEFFNDEYAPLLYMAD